MKINSVSCFTVYVKDLNVTATFYEALGFRPGKREFVLRDPDGYKLVFFQNSKKRLEI